MSTITTNGSSDACHDGCKRKFAVIACPSCHQLALTLVGLQTCGSDSALCHEHLNTIVQKDFFVSNVPVKICGTCQGHEVAAKGTEWSEADRKAEEKDDGEEEKERGKYDLFTSDSSSEAEGSEYDRDDERYYDDGSDDGYEYSDDDSAYGLRAIPEEDEDEDEEENAEEGDQGLEPRTSLLIPGDDSEEDEEGETDDADDNADESSEPPISARNLFPPMFHEDSTQSFPYIPEGPPPLEDLIFSDDEDWNRNSTEE
ncbi:hypothetical protein LIA77_11643 [Sarocladium implicatum]|nr:hypothetical protein LIA77_11643 [Sarocladium implicatum]